MPPCRYRAAWKVSRKKPRASRKTSGSTITTPGSSVWMNFKGSPLEAVPVTAHGEEVARLLRVGLQLDPQRAHEVVDRPRRALVLRAPAAGKDVVAAEGAAVGGEEQAQHLELLRADIDGGSLPRDDLAVEIDLHLSESDHRALFRRRRPPPQQSLHARQQLAEAERLAQVVVGAELPPEDLVALHPLGGQHQDGSGRALLSHLLEQLVAVEAWKHDVEHDQVDVRLQRHAQADLAVLGDAHVVAVPSQVEAEAEGDGAVVFDDEDARHRGAPLGRREDYAERAALSDPAVQLDAPAVQLDDLLGDGEPQAGPLGPAGEQVFGAVEPLEDPFSIVGPHAGSVVLHLDGDVAPRAPGAHADALFLPSVLHGVVQQVEHHLRHGVAILVHGRKLWIELRLVAGGQLLRLERRTDAIEQGRNLGPLQL